jgi:RHS repeat-associated protein
MQPAPSTRIPDGFMAAMRLEGEKPHQGLPGRNPALYQGPTVCNSTTALGLRGQAELNRVGSCSTGKERDTESGNDYFDARYYSSAMGRFMSPDWSAKEEPVPYSKLDNPQTLNLYSYVVNNPLTQIDDDGHEIIYMTTGPNALQNEQVVRDSVTAILANPNTAGNLSGYVGKDNPDLVIMNGDLSKLDNPTQAPDGSPGASITKGDAEPVMSTSTDANGNKTDPQFSGAIITIDNRTSAGDTPSVMTHETVHAGEMKANPNQFVKDSAAEKNMPHDKRPQEQRANAAQNKYGPAITKAVKQMEKARKKEQQ